ncbi:MAG: hypothetical protein L3J63_05645, partial [Geopsychrobacter sp.]|nr:hypothetical protein [Geopsychrobacter sp.]
MARKHQFFTGFWLLFLLCSLATRTLAETPVKTEAPAASKSALPGLSELGPRVGNLTDLVEKSETSLKLLADLKAARTDLTTLSTQLRDLHDKSKPLGNPKDWYVDRLNQFNNQFLQLKKNLEGLQARLTDRQKQVEEIIAKSRQEDDFWQQWKKELRAQKVAVPVKTIGQVKTLLARLNKAEKKTTSAILKLQEQTGSLQQQLSSELDQFASALAALRKATFRKNTHSFFAPDFRAKFNERLWQNVREGWQSVSKVDWSYLQRHAWVFGLLLAGLVLSFVIRSYSHPLQEHQEWKFVTDHPFAAGGFITVLLMGNLFPAPPAQLRFSLMVAGVMTGSILAADLVENRRQAKMLYLAALVLLLTTGFRLINLPQPLYRLYIALLALGTIPLLISQLRTSRLKCGTEAGRLFRSLLSMAVAVLLIALIAQIAGYINFSSWLLQATFETGMLLLFAHMILRLGCGGVSFLLHQTPLAKRKFFKRYNGELAQRIDHFLRMLVVFYSIFYLLPLWRLFASSREAWDILSGYSFPLGSSSVSIEMLTLALLTFY